MKSKILLISILFLQFITLSTLSSCSKDDDYENFSIEENFKVYEVPSKGGNYTLSIPQTSNHTWQFDAFKIQTGEKIVTLFSIPEISSVCKNQNLTGAIGYKSKDYSVYQKDGSKNVICEIGKNTTGEERTFIVEFEDGDEFTKVRLHQSK